MLEALLAFQKVEKAKPVDPLDETLKDFEEWISAVENPVTIPESLNITPEQLALAKKYVRRFRGMIWTKF